MTLSHVVEDILELPRENKEGKGYEIVRRMFKAIEEALQRGESVSILGFGTFRPHRVAQKRNKICPLAGKFFPLIPSLHQEIVVIPARNTARFKPNLSLLRFINEDQEAKKETDHASTQS